MIERRRFYGSLHIFVLFGFAVAQPLFDLLSQNADFLVAHDLRPLDLLILASILSLLLPGVLVLVEAVASLLHRRLGDYVHGLAAGLLVAAVALQAFKKLLGGPGIQLLVGSIVVGLFSGWVACRVRPFQSFLTFLSPAIVAFPAFFLLRPPVSELIFFEERKVERVQQAVSSDIPIVLLVFDEFSTSALMDQHLEINAFRYPNFTALARESYWFRNASTVAERTMRVIPSILTGRYIKKIVPATAANYPDNLFTWLGGSYELNALETYVRLCPDDLCHGPIAREGFGERFRTTLSDLWFICLHATLPGDLTQNLPPVTRTIRDFGRTSRASKSTAAGELKHRRRGFDWVFSQFVNGVQPTDAPVLHFLHIVIPHTPWTYLPSGKQYRPKGVPVFTHGLKRGVWSGDDWESVQGFQRYLLQVGYADRLLGTLLARLHETKLYDLNYALRGAPEEG